MTVLQQIVKEAKRMRKLHPNKYSKWTDYVKAAAKTIKPAAKKVGAVKNNLYNVIQKNGKYFLKKQSDTSSVYYPSIIFTGTKKNAENFIEKNKVGAVKKKKAPASRHTDKGSHNVKIRVVSGIDSNKFYINLLSKIESEIKEKQALSDIINKNYKDPKNKALRSYWASKRNAVNKNILMLKRQQNAIKKSIK